MASFPPLVDLVRQIVVYLAGDYLTIGVRRQVGAKDFFIT